MDTNIAVFSYNGNPVTFDTGAGLTVNATEMAKAFPGKRTSDWLKNQSTNEFLNELSNVRNLVFADLVQVRQGAPENGGGTWMHEDVALEFARWLSPAFAIWCNDRIKELLTKGTTAVAHFDIPKTYAQALLLAAHQAEQIEEQEKQIAEQNALLIAQGEAIADKDKAIDEMSAKVSYLDRILASPSTVTTTQIAADYGMSAKKFNIQLRNLRIQRKVGGQWILYSPFNTRGYVHSETFIPSGSESGKVVMTSKWTQKGRLFLYDTLKNAGILPMIERQ